MLVVPGMTSFQTLDQIGRVVRVNEAGLVEVVIQGRGWLYNPECLLPAPGETAQGDMDPQCSDPIYVYSIPLLVLFNEHHALSSLYSALHWDIDSWNEQESAEGVDEDKRF